MGVRAIRLRLRLRLRLVVNVKVNGRPADED